MDNQQSTKKDSRQRWRESRSALRILLKHPDIHGIEQFMRIRFRATTYIYNTKANNIIATCRVTPRSRRRLVRYRPNSHYADILQTWRSDFNPVVIPSTTLSHMQRRIGRESANISVMTLQEANQLLYPRPQAVEPEPSPEVAPDSWLDQRLAQTWTLTRSTSAQIYYEPDQ